MGKVCDERAAAEFIGKLPDQKKVLAGNYYLDAPERLLNPKGK